MKNYTPSESILGGRYLSRESMLHSVKPEYKLALAFLMIISASIGGAVILGPLLAACLTGFYLAGVSFPKVLKGLKSFIVFLLVLGLFPVIFTEGTPLQMPFYFPLEISQEGLAEGGISILRFLVMVLISMLLVFTVHPSAMVKVMDKRLPAIKSRALREFIQVGIMAMQALPGLFHEGEKFIAANPGSGIKGRGITKVRQIAKLVIPFMVHIFKNMDQMGENFFSNNGRENEPV